MALSIKLLSGEGYLSIHRQVVNAIRHAISSGRLHPGDKLLSVRKLAMDLRVSPNTIARAYRDLEQEGLTQNIAGRGTFVRQLMPGRDHDASQATAFDILRPALATLAGMGLSDAEIRRAVEQLLINAPFYLGVVGTSERGARKWAGILEYELRDFWVQTVPVVLDDFAKDREGLLSQLSNATHIFTLLAGYSSARAHLAGTGKKVIPLITELSPKTHQALSQLPQDRKIGLISENIYINSVLELLGDYCSVSNVICVRDEDNDGVERLMRSVEIVLYTSSSGESLEGIKLTTCKLIPLEYRINRENVQQIKEMVSVFAKKAADRAA